MSYQRIPTDTDNKDLHHNVEMQNLGTFNPQAQAQQAPLLGQQGAQVIFPQAHMIVTPPAPSPEELEATLRTRRVQFDSQRYISEGWTFAKHNCCSIMQIMLVLVLVGLFTHGISFLLLRGIYGEDFMQNQWHDGVNGTSEEPHSFHMRLFQSHLKHWREQEDPEGPEGPDGPPPPPAAVNDEDDDDDDDDDDKDEQMIGFMIMGFLQALLIYGLLTAGGFMTVFEAMRTNSKMKWRSLFSAFQCPYYRRLLPLNLWLILGKGIGFHLLLLPGILFSVFTCFALPLHGEHRWLTGCKAMKHSYWVVRNHFCSLICFFFLLILLNFLGALAVGIGLLITAPVSIFAFCYCYAHLVGVNGVPMMVPINSTTPLQPQPPQPQPQPTQQPQPTFQPSPSTPSSTSPSYIPPIAAPVAPAQYVLHSVPGYQIPTQNPYPAYQIMATPVVPTSPTHHVVSMQPIVTATAPASTPSVPTQGSVNYPTSLYPAQYPTVTRS